MSVIGSNALAGASGQGGGGYVIEKSLRFNNDDTPYLNRTPSSAGNRTTWTWSSWVKLSSIPTSNQNLFSSLGTTGNQFYVYFNTSSKLIISDYEAYVYTRAELTSSRVFRDFSGWYHLVIVMDSSQATAADRVKLYVNGVQETLTGTQPNQNTEAFWNNANAHYIGRPPNNTTDIFDGYLTDVHFVDGQALDPTSFGAYDDNNVWQAKEYTGSHGTNGFHLDFADGNDIGNDAAGSNNWTVNNLTATGGTVNYAEAISGSPYIPFNAFSTSYISNYVNTSTWAITNAAWDGAWDSSGNTNVFTPSGGIAVSSSLIVYYGNYNNAASTTTLTITYTDSSTETDTFTSGSSNWMGSFTASNAAGKTIQSIQVVGPSSAAYQSFGGFVIDGQILTSANPNADILRDSPTNGDATADTVSGNYCTFNPLANYGTLSDGNLNVAQTSVAHTTTYGTLGVSSGKWYWEIYKDDGNNYSGTSGGVGVAATEYTANGSGYLGSNYTNVAYFQSGVQLYDGSDGYESLTTVLGSGEEHKKGTWMLAFDFDSGKGWVGKNGVWLSDTTAGNEGNPATGANPCFNAFVSGANYVPMVGMYASQSFTANFGARPFAYAAPSGFKALCTTNLPTPTIADGSTAFDAVLYSGTGNAQSITGLGFSPDLVWTKNRGASASHAVYDSVRGAGELIRTNETSAEVTVSSRFTSFDSNGFSIGSTSSENNASSNTYVSWAWDAGDSNTSISAGSLSTSIYNQDQVWSNFLSSSNGFVGGYEATYAFNGVIDTGGGSATNGVGGVMTFAPTSTLSVSTMEIRVYSDTTITFPDSSTVAVSGQGSGSGWITVNLPSSFTGFTGSNNITLHNTNGGLQYFDGLKINGKILANSNISLTVPQVASTVRANPSAGFSIVKWTAPSWSGSPQSVAHNLNHAPAFIITKGLDNAASWYCYHKDLDASNPQEKYLTLNDTGAVSTLGSSWGTSAPDSNVFGDRVLGWSGGQDVIAYCFAPVEGYSAFGSYTGNGSTDGVFVYTNFRPAFIVVKRTNSSGNWHAFDTKRDPDNRAEAGIYPNLSSAEAVVYFADINSNGFKLRTSNAELNGNGDTYIYAAFAENPFQANGGLAR